MFLRYSTSFLRYPPPRTGWVTTAAAGGGGGGVPKRRRDKGCGRALITLPPEALIPPQSRDAYAGPIPRRSDGGIRRRDTWTANIRGAVTEGGGYPSTRGEEGKEGEEAPRWYLLRVGEEGGSIDYIRIFCGCIFGGGGE